MSLDPYTPPAAAEPHPEPQTDRSSREIVVGWERLRLICNLVLAFPGVLISIWSIHRHGMPFFAGVAGALMVAVGANACFFLGPLAELYLRVLFLRSQPSASLRKWLFYLGVAVSLAFFACAAFLVGSSSTS